MPLGSSRVKKSYVKILAATNENLEELVEKKLFRGDLLQRLQISHLSLPALRSRSDLEKQEILNFLLERLNKMSLDQKKKDYPYVLSKEVQTLLLSYDWKSGNIREMWNTLQAMSVESDHPVLGLSSLPRHFKKKLSNFINKEES